MGGLWPGAVTALAKGRWLLGQEKCGKAGGRGSKRSGSSATEWHMVQSPHLAQPGSCASLLTLAADVSAPVTAACATCPLGAWVSVSVWVWVSVRVSSACPWQGCGACCAVCAGLGKTSPAAMASPAHARQGSKTINRVRIRVRISESGNGRHYMPNQRRRFDRGHKT